MKSKRLTLKIFTVMMAFCLVLSLGFTANLDNASASTTQIKSPTDDTIYFINKKITVKVTAGMMSLEPGYKSYMQVEILKSGKRVYFKNVRFTELGDITFPAYTPKKTGTYKIKAGVVFTQDDPPNKIHKVQEESSFVVKSASYVKEMQPAISAKRDGKKIKISCSNRPAGVKMLIYRSTKKSTGYKKIKTVTASTYTDKVTSSTKTYYYKVKFSYTPKTTTYKSKFSKILTVKKVVTTTGSIHVYTPTLTASGKVKVKWDKVSGAGYYLIHRSTKSGTMGDVVCCNGDSELEYLDSDVTKGKTYYYTVEAWYGNDEKPLCTSEQVKIKIPE